MVITWPRYFLWIAQSIRYVFCSFIVYMCTSVRQYSVHSTEHIIHITSCFVNFFHNFIWLAMYSRDSVCISFCRSGIRDNYCFWAMYFQRAVSHVNKWTFLVYVLFTLETKQFWRRSPLINYTWLHTRNRSRDKCDAFMIFSLYPSFDEMIQWSRSFNKVFLEIGKLSNKYSALLLFTYRKD